MDDIRDAIMDCTSGLFADTAKEYSIDSEQVATEKGQDSDGFPTPAALCEETSFQDGSTRLL